MSGTDPSPCPPHPAAHTGWDSQGGFLIRFSLPPPSPIQRTGQGRVYCTLSWSQACAGFSHELADPTTALCYGGSQPQFTVEETQASRGWGIAQVTQLVSSRAPEPALPTWYCPAPTAPAPQQALPLSPVSLWILLVSHLEHLLCFACPKLCLFLSLSFPQAPHPFVRQNVL